MNAVISDLTSAKARKFWVGLAGVVSLIVGANILPEQWKVYAEAFLGLLTAVGVYAVPNAVDNAVPETPAAVPAAPVADSTGAKMDKGSTIG